jgi:hypothetical protein
VRTVSADLLDVVLGAATESIVVAGTAKNVGKTVTFNALRAAARVRGILGGVTSIGRDGEAADALDGGSKPRVRLDPGTVVALPRALVPASPALEIVDIGERSALGTIVFARVRTALSCEIGGPPTARGVRATIDRLRVLADGPVFVDGALDRLAPLAGGDDAVVVATGAQSGASVEAVAALVGEVVARLSIPGRDPAREAARVVRLAGALDARVAEELVTVGGPLTVVVDDPTRVVVRGKLFARLTARVDLRCEHPIRVVACTTSSLGRNIALDPRALVRAVAAATRRPTFDVLAGLVA